MATQAAQAIPSSPAAPQNGNSPGEKLVNGVNLTPKKRTKPGGIQALAVKYIPLWNTFKNSRSERETTKKPPEKKPLFTLSFWGLLLLLAFEVLILILITVLWALTTRNNGFVDVPDTPASIIGSQKYPRKTSALEDCQSTMELRKAKSHRIQEKSKAKLTVLLDYRSDWFPFMDSYHAFRNKHRLIGACTIVRWFFAAIGPLAAAIISVGNVPSSKRVQVTTSTYFNDYKNESTSRLAFEAASAILLNDGSPYPWVTEVYSIVPFFAESDTPGNLTADTGSYSAMLQCESFDVDSLSSVGNITIEPGVYGDVATFNFEDRGCSISPWMGLSPAPPLFSRTYFQDCPLDADWARLVLMTGYYVPSSPYLLSNFSLTSCIPYFWKSTSRVTVLSGPSASKTLGQPGQVVDVVSDVSSVKRWWPFLWNRWTREIPEYSVADPRGQIDADNFGFIAYSYVLKSNGTADFAQAMNTTFSVLFATFAKLSTYDPLSENSTFTGTLSRPGNRLFVVLVPATVVTFVMALSFVVTVWVAVYAYQHRVILKEHVDLILGHAILLQENEGVREYVTNVREDFKTQAGLAIRAAAARKARKTGETESETAIELRVEHAVKYGDLVQYAEDTRGLNEWDCWVEDGKLCMESGPTSTPS